MSVSAWITLSGEFFKTCILIISGPGAFFNGVDTMIFLLFSMIIVRALNSKPYSPCE